LPHVNFNGTWDCLGVDLGANTIHDDATLVYVGDVVTPSELPHLYNTDLIAFIDHFRASPGGGIAAAHQVSNHQLDVFFIGDNEALYVAANHGRFSPYGSLVAGPYLAGVSVLRPILQSLQIVTQQIRQFTSTNIYMRTNKGGRELCRNCVR
jgi:hypothetical protein